MLTLEGVTSEEVCNWMCSCVLDYEVRTRGGRFVEAYDILKAMVECVHNMIRCANLI